MVNSEFESSTVTSVVFIVDFSVMVESSEASLIWIEPSAESVAGSK